MNSNLYNIRRWTAQRKAAFLAAVEAEQIGAEEISRLGISLQELRAWQRAFAAHGTVGLRARFRHRCEPAARAGNGATHLGRAHR
jgi:hypothetical protein